MIVFSVSWEFLLKSGSEPTKIVANVITFEM